MVPVPPGGGLITDEVAGMICPPGSIVGNRPVASGVPGAAPTAPWIAPMTAPDGGGGLVPCQPAGPKAPNRACRSPDSSWVKPRPSRTRPPNHAANRPVRLPPDSRASTKYTPPMAMSCRMVSVE